MTRPETIPPGWLSIDQPVNGCHIWWSGYDGPIGHLYVGPHPRSVGLFLWVKNVGGAWQAGIAATHEVWGWLQPDPSRPQPFVESPHYPSKPSDPQRYWFRKGKKR